MGRAGLSACCLDCELGVATRRANVRGRTASRKLPSFCCPRIPEPATLRSARCMCVPPNGGGVICTVRVSGLVGRGEGHRRYGLCLGSRSVPGRRKQSRRRTRRRLMNDRAEWKGNRPCPAACRRVPHWSAQTVHRGATPDFRRPHRCRHRPGATRADACRQHAGSVGTPPGVPVPRRSRCHPGVAFITGLVRPFRLGNNLPMRLRRPLVRTLRFQHPGTAPLLPAARPSS